MLSRILRYLMLLALVVWLGGIIFFGAVMAPVLFNVLPSTELAGNVIAPSLKILHAIGLTAGVIFLVNFFLIPRRVAGNRFARLIPIFILVMLALTAISQFYVMPRMENLRPQMAGYTYATRLPDLERQSAAARHDFDSLHHWSTRIESTVLILGLFALAYFVDSDSVTTKNSKDHKGKG
jgi:hypothetical protein